MNLEEVGDGKQNGKNTVYEIPKECIKNSIYIKCISMAPHCYLLCLVLIIGYEIGISLMKS